jgi:chromosome segregation ATPase
MMINTLKGKRKREMMRTFCKISSQFQRGVTETGRAFEQLTTLMEENVFGDSDDDETK